MPLAACMSVHATSMSLPQQVLKSKWVIIKEPPGNNKGGTLPGLRQAARIHGRGARHAQPARPGRQPRPHGRVGEEAQVRGQRGDQAHRQQAVQQVGDPRAGGGRPVGPHTRRGLQVMAQGSADG